MSLRRVDARFLLPRFVRTAAVLGPVPGWRDGLEEAGIRVVDGVAGRGSLDLVVAAAARARDALALTPESVIVEGRGARGRFRGSPFLLRRFMPLPSPAEPQLLLPIDQPLPGRYAVAHWTVPTTRWKASRNHAVRALLGARRLPEPRSVVAVATAPDAQPFLVRRAAALGVPHDADWFLTLGEGDALTRGVFHLFPRNEPEPRWVLKFARVPGYREPFDRDEEGLSLAQAAGPPVAANVPRLLGRFECEGLHASVESSAVGMRLTSALEIGNSRADKLELVGLVGDWILRLGEATAAPASSLDEERRRLLQEVVPQWSGAGAAADLVSRLPPIPAVSQHNDVGPWNIIVHRSRHFTVVDWESARKHGLPLWDLLYFLSEALALVDGAATPAARETHFVQLFRGELESSMFLFSYVARAAGAASVPAGAVGAVTTLCWLHHGLSHLRRRTAAGRWSAAAPPQEEPTTARAARLWLSDPVLGPGWDRWQAS